MSMCLPALRLGAAGSEKERQKTMDNETVRSDAALCLCWVVMGRVVAVHGARKAVSE